MAITDATAGAGLPVGSTARLGGREILVRQEGAFLEEGTLAGSTLTMNRAFDAIVSPHFASAAGQCRPTVMARGALSPRTALNRNRWPSAVTAY